MSRRMRTLLLALPLMAGLSACSTGTGTTSFVAQNDSGALFIRWTNGGTGISGSLTMFDASITGEDGGTARTEGFTGVAAGASVSFNFPQGSAFVGMTGTIDGDQLTLSVPGSPGPTGFQTYTLHRGTEADFDVALATFRARQKLNAPVVQASSRMATTIEALQALPPLRDALQAPSGKPYIDYVKADYADLSTSVDQYLAGTGDWSTVEWAALSICGMPSELIVGGSGLRRLNDAISAEQSAIGNLEDAARQLELAMAANQGAAPPLTMPSAARAAADAARQAIKSALASWDDDSRTAKTLTSAAKIVYDKGATKARKNGETVIGCNP